MSALAYDLRRTMGYIVADSHGRVLGKVESPMYGTRPDEPDAISVRKGFFGRDRPPRPARERPELPLEAERPSRSRPGTTTGRISERPAIGRQLPAHSPQSVQAGEDIISHFAPRA